MTAVDQNPRLQRLLDKDEIRDCITLFFKYVDAFRFKETADLFTEDCVGNLREDGKPIFGRQALLELLEGSDHNRAPTAAGAPVRYHHFSNVYIAFDDVDHATASMSLYAYTIADRVIIRELWGDYVDIFVRTTSGWKIQELTLNRTARRTPE